ncbi:UPF0160 domain protein MYG1 [Aspergillus sclerotialis]|uniref:UPF0160 domain protein MYG1 n=1 Tax=Aspergillus sclerotialis TaxID=2070753 RepID=A0A3A2ZIL8_9EURO|nr:UPF0160 domain protein MYG1 [Aspergillus sclerotialis]
MAEPVKKLKTTNPLIGTHNGHFHADEALAIYLLRLLPLYSSSPLLRSRDPAQLATCHTVVDVGGEYDPSTNRYDHHQRTFSTTFPNHNTKLSSAGLVYMHFGRAIIAQQTAWPLDHDNVSILYEKLYTDFIEAIDANDNGVSVTDPTALSEAGIEKRFKDFGLTIPSIVGDMNRNRAGEDLDEDALFEKASRFIGDVFAHKLHLANSLWLPARTTVKNAYATRKEVHPSGRVMVLPQSGTPWKEHLYGCEKEEAGKEVAPGEAAEDHCKVYYVLYPESAAEDAKWRVQCVPVTESSFESRRPLPEAWRGVRDEDLDKVMNDDAEKSGKAKIPEGAVFVHASGFIGGHKTKEGAYAMASRSLE